MIQVEVYKYTTIQTTLGVMVVVNEEDGNGKVIAQWFPIRAQCVLLELDVDRQKRSARQDYPDALREIPVELPVGWRRVQCIRKKEFALWLAGIDPKRCKLGAQRALESYRQEVLAAADRILWKNINLGSASAILPSDTPRETQVEIRAIGLCPCCNRVTRVLIEDGVTVLQHVDDTEAE